MITLEIVEGMDCGAGDQQLRKGLGYHSADGPTETIEYNSTLRGTTLPKSGKGMGTSADSLRADERRERQNIGTARPSTHNLRGQ